MSGIDTYAIGVSLDLNTAIFTSLGKLDDELGIVEASVQRINALLGATPALVASVAGAARGMASAFADAAKSAGKIRDAMAGGFSGNGGGLSVSTPSGGVVFSDGSSPMIIPAQGIPAPSGGGYGVPAVIPGSGPSGYSGWGWTGDTGYNGYMPGPTPGPAPGTALTGYYGPQDPNFTMPGADEPFFDPAKPMPGVPIYPPRGGGGAGGSFDPLSMYFVGGAVARAGWGMVAHPFDQAATVDQKIAILRNMGISGADANAAYGDAVAMQGQRQYSTLTVDDLLTIIAGNLAQTHNLPETMGLMPTLANAATVLQGQGMTDPASSLVDLTRTGDLAGMFNKRNADGTVDLAPFEKFVQVVMAAEQTAAASGDAITPDQILKFYQNMGAPGQTLSATGEANAITLALTLGQYRAGSGLGQIFKEMVGGKMPEGVEDQLAKAGLVSTKGSVRHGQYVTLAPGALKDEKLLLSDPIQWFSTVFAPAYQAAGPDQRAELIHAIYAGTATQQGARVALDAIFNNPLIMRQLDYQQDVPGLPQAAANYTMTPTGAAKGAGNALNTLEISVENAVITSQSGVLRLVTGAANAAANAANASPDLTGDAVIDGAIYGTLAALGVWGGKIPLVGGALKGFGIAGVDLAGGPVGVAILGAQILKAIYDYGNAHPSSPVGPETEHGQARVAITDGPGSSFSQPLFVAVTNGATLVSPSPTMPTGPTQPNASKSPPMPGQVARVSGHN